MRLKPATHQSDLDILRQKFALSLVVKWSNPNERITIPLAGKNGEPEEMSEVREAVMSNRVLRKKGKVRR